MKMSVVVPSFNQSRYLEAALASIVLQAGDGIDLECIVMDGGSSDDSPAVLKSWERRMADAGVRYRWSSGADRGQTDAINRGMALTAGEVLAYLNSDDQYLPGALLAVRDAFERTPSASWVTGCCRIVDAGGRPVQRLVSMYRNGWLNWGSPRSLRLLNFIAQPATFWSRQAADALGAFDESLHYAMDYDFWLRLAARGRPVILRDELAAFRIHGSSKGGSAYQAQFREDYEVLCRYEDRTWVRAFHRMHNAAVVAAYRFLK